jgi:hypothetical protein
LSLTVVLAWRVAMMGSASFSPLNPITVLTSGLISVVM